MFFMKYKKTISCLIVITLILPLLTMGFPGNVSALEDSTVNSEVILDTQQLTLDSNEPATSKGIINPPRPEIDKEKSNPDIVILPSPKKGDGKSSNDGIFIKRVSNMPKLVDVPEPFVPLVNNEPINSDTKLINENKDNMELMDTRQPDKSDNETYPIKNKEGLYKVGFTSKSGQNLLQFTHGNTGVEINPLAPNQVDWFD